MSALKKTMTGLVVVVVVVVAISWLGTRALQGPEIPQGETTLRFSEVSIDWVHSTDLTTALPFMGAAIIDADGDGVEEVFVGGGSDQQDALFVFDGSGFKASPLASGLRKTQMSPTYGAASLDVTRNGFADLFVAREDGVWFYQNSGAGFSGERIPFEIAENTAPLSIAIGDIDNDGWADLYVSGYIKIAFVEGETIFNQHYGAYSYLLRNNGDNTWSDVSRDAGVWRQHNTFTAAFVDLDRDGDSDLAIAQDTGTVEMYENSGTGRFALLPRAPEYSYPMGLAFGDYDNDGLIDLYFSNVGNTLPSALLRGDLRDDQVLNKDYMLLRNDGALQFSDRALETDSAKHGFGWGVVMHDLDLDGRQDLIAAQNYARFPGVKYLDLYKGRLLKQYADGKFAPVEEVSGAANPHFGMTPMVADFDRNGRPDLVWVNLTGPLRVVLNRGSENHYLTVKLPNDMRALGALVTVTLEDGRRLTDVFATSEGLGSDSSHELHFGLGANLNIDQVTIQWPGGEQQSIDNPPANQVLEVAAVGAGVVR